MIPAERPSSITEAHEPSIEADLSPSEHPVARRRTLRLIAMFEGVKGLAALAASIGILSLLRHDLRHLAEALIGRYDLDPGAHYPAILLHYADVLQDANVRSLIFLAIGYISIRLFEAYGLWNDYAWAEWLGALSGAVYVPFEIRHLLHRPSWSSAAVLIGNIFVVFFLLYQLWRRGKTHRQLSAATVTSGITSDH